MFSGSLIAATPPVDRQEKSSYADKDSPSARRDSFCESAFPTLCREPMLCLRQRASPAKGALKSMYRPSRGSLTLSSRFRSPIYGRYSPSEKVDPTLFFSLTFIAIIITVYNLYIDTTAYMYINTIQNILHIEIICLLYCFIYNLHITYRTF